MPGQGGGRRGADPTRDAGHERHRARERLRAHRRSVTRGPELAIGLGEQRPAADRDLHDDRVQIVRGDRLVNQRVDLGSLTREGRASSTWSRVAYRRGGESGFTAADLNDHRAVASAEPASDSAAHGQGCYYAERRLARRFAASAIGRRRARRGAGRAWRAARLAIRRDTRVHRSAPWRPRAATVCPRRR